MLPTIEKKPLLKPPLLREGDRVGLIAPSSRPATPGVVANAERLVRDMGFTPVAGKHVLSVHGFMAGTDSERLSDFSAFVDDDSIRALFCVSGGYGAMHLLPFLDYGKLQRNPKIIMGCSDNTVLLNVIHARTGLITFHGPNLDEVNSRETFESIKRAVSSADALPQISARRAQPFDDGANTFYCPVEGIAEGPLVGGNLTSFVTLLGTPFEPRMTGSIIFLDDIREQTGILDRWFTTLYLAGHLQTCRGVICGAFEDCGPKDSANMLHIMDVFADRLRYLGTPSAFGFPLGQTRSTNVIPIGVNVRVDCGAGVLEFQESALGT